jgi:hypothetical protein
VSLYNNNLYLSWLPHPDVLDEAMLDEQDLQVSLTTGSVQVTYIKQQSSAADGQTVLDLREAQGAFIS